MKGVTMKYLAVIGLLVAACGGDTKFVECEQNSNCSLGAGGICASNPLTGNHWCTYPCNADNDDNACASGRCWSDFDVGDGVGGTCFGGFDAGVEPMADAMDAASPDAAVDAGDVDAAVNGPLATIVFGQSDFDTGDANQGGIGKDTLFAPQGVFAMPNSNGMWIVDSGNQRVLQWDSPPSTNKSPANWIYGQTTATGMSAGTTQSTFNFQPNAGAQGEGVTSDGTRVIVTDSGNNGVLIWAGPIGGGPKPTDGWPADIVLGQSDFTSNTAGDGQGQMRNPRGVWTDGTRLVVSDSGNNRVLIWNTFPTTNGQLPDLVLGQSDFGMSNAASPPTASSLAEPRGVTYDGTRLWVADTGNNRVLAWSAFPTASGQGANFVLGQMSMTGSMSNQGGSTGAATLASPYDVAVGLYEGVATLFVADSYNKRVVVYNGLPSTTGAAAIAVYGQPSLTTGPPDDSVPPTQGTLKFPNGVSVQLNRLYVSDGWFSGAGGAPNRVLQFTLP